jgi:hypothetical protein
LGDFGSSGNSSGILCQANDKRKRGVRRVEEEIRVVKKRKEINRGGREAGKVGSRL